MTLDTTKKAFIDWVRQVTTYAATKVVWADQNMPRPVKPYMTLKLTAFSQPNRRYTAPPDNTGKAEIISHKEFTLSINNFEASGIDPMTAMLNLHDSLGRVNDYAILRTAKIAYVDTLLGPLDISEKVDTIYEPRAVLDLKMRIPWTVDDANQGLIQSVAVGALTLDVQGVTIMNDVINIP